MVQIFARSIDVQSTGLISAKGGDGGGGGAKAGTGNPGSAGGSGGGGLVYLVYEWFTSTASVPINVNGGTPGVATSPGGNGVSGTAGVILRYNAAAKVWE